MSVSAYAYEQRHDCVWAAKKTQTAEEALAEREILTTSQDKTIRTGEDNKARVIITSDLEVDDMNSFINQCLFFNEIDLAGIVVSASFCHFTGDGGENIHVSAALEDPDGDSMTA